MKINVIPEGRENIWIPEQESLKAFILSKNFETIHNFKGGSILMGANHEVKSVLDDIDNCERSAIFTDAKANMGHSLALIINNSLEMYDIGKITLDDITPA